MTLLEDKRFIREGRSIREWILDLASEQKEVRDKASNVIQAMQYGIPSVDTDLTGFEFDEEIERQFSKAIKEVFSDASFPVADVMLQLIDTTNMINLEIIKHAGTNDRTVVNKLIDILEKDTYDDVLAETAAEAIGNIRPRVKTAFPALFKKICNSANPHFYAGPIAQIIQDDEALQKQVILFLSDTNIEIVSACLYILSRLDITIDIMNPLKNLSRHQEEKIRGLVARVYGKIGNDNDEIRDILLEMIKTEKEHNKSVAIESLAKTCSNSEIAVPILINALSDSDYSFCVYEGCVESAAVYLLEHVNKTHSMRPFEEILPILLNDVKKMDGISNADDDLERIQLLSKFGPKAKKVLPKLKKYLKSYLEDDPKAKEKNTRCLKQAVEAIEKE